jgi:hypothetical protein
LYSTPLHFEELTVLLNQIILTTKSGSEWVFLRAGKKREAKAATVAVFPLRQKGIQDTPNRTELMTTLESAKSPGPQTQFNTTNKHNPLI